MKRSKTVPTPLMPPGGVRRHGAAIFDDAPHDPYLARGKYPEPTVCRDCGAFYQRGRWRWGDAPEGAHAALCPACHRIRDRLPAGEVRLASTFIDSHREELVSLARNEEAHEKREHPLHRIMDIDQGEGRMTVTTTDIHLPRRIAEAVRHAYQGELVLEYGKDEYRLRAEWHR